MLPHDPAKIARLQALRGSHSSFGQCVSMVTMTMLGYIGGVGIDGGQGESDYISGEGNAGWARRDGIAHRFVHVECATV